MPTRKLNESILLAAIQGFEARKIQIDQQILELKAMLSERSAETSTKPGAPARKRRKMSAAGRKAIAEAQRKRWAALKGQSAAVTPGQTPTNRKRKLSAAGRAAISAATKKRWALKRAAEAPSAGKTSPGIRKAAVRSPRAKAARRAPVKKAAKSAQPASSTQAAG